MKKLLFLTLSFGLISQLNADINPNISRPESSLTTSCKGTGSLQTISIQGFTVSFCSNANLERNEILKKLQEGVQKELGPKQKAA